MTETIMEVANQIVKWAMWSEEGHDLVKRNLCDMHEELKVMDISIDDRIVCKGLIFSAQKEIEMPHGAIDWAAFQLKIMSLLEISAIAERRHATGGW